METEIRVISVLENIIDLEDIMAIKAEQLQIIVEVDDLDKYRSDIKSEEGLFDTFGGISIYVEQHY